MPEPGHGVPVYAALWVHGNAGLGVVTFGMSNPKTLMTLVMKQDQKLLATAA